MSGKGSYPFPPNPNTPKGFPSRLQPLQPLPSDPSKVILTYPTHNTNTGYQSHDVLHKHRLKSKTCSWMKSDLYTYARNTGYGIGEHSLCPSCNQPVREHEDGVTTLTTSTDRFDDDYRSSEYESFDVGKGNESGSFLRSEEEDGVTRRGGKSKSSRKSRDEESHSHSKSKRSRNKRNKRKLSETHDVDSDTRRVAEELGTSVAEQRKVASLIHDDIERSMFSKGQMKSNPRKEKRLRSEKRDESGEGNNQNEERQVTEKSSGSSHLQVTIPLIPSVDQVASQNDNDDPFGMHLDAAHDIEGRSKQQSSSSDDQLRRVIDNDDELPSFVKNYQTNVKVPLSKEELLTTDNEPSVAFQNRFKYVKKTFEKKRGAPMRNIRMTQDQANKMYENRVELRRLRINDDNRNDVLAKMKEQAKICQKTYEILYVEYGSERMNEADLRCDTCAALVSLHDREPYICELSRIEVDTIPSKEAFSGCCSICYKKVDEHVDANPAAPENFSVIEQDSEFKAYKTRDEKRKEKQAELAKRRSEHHHHNQQFNIEAEDSGQTNAQVQGKSSSSSTLSPFATVETNHVEPLSARHGDEIRKRKQGLSEEKSLKGKEFENFLKNTQRRGSSQDEKESESESSESNWRDRDTDPSDDDDDDDESDDDDSSSSESDKDSDDDEYRPPGDRDKSSNNDQPSKPDKPGGDDDDPNIRKLRNVCKKFVEEFEECRRTDEFLCDRCGFSVIKHRKKPECIFTQQDFVGVDVQTHECARCQAPVRIHRIRAETGSSKSANLKIHYDMFPKFTTKSDPYEFMSQFEDAIKLTALPKDRWVPLLKHVVEDIYLKQWITETFVDVNMPWMGDKGVKNLFLLKTVPPNYQPKLQAELSRLRNYDLKDLQEFFMKYRDKCYKLNYNMSDARTVHECEFKLCKEVKEFLRNYRISKLSVSGETADKPEFSSVQALQEAAEMILRIPVHNYSKDKNNSNDKDKTEKSNKSRRFRRFNKNKNESDKSEKKSDNDTDKKEKKKNKSSKFANVEEDKSAQVNKITQQSDFNMHKSKNNTDFSKKQDNNKNSEEKRKCFKCGKQGHLKKDCPEKQKAKDNKPAKFSYFSANFDRGIEFNAMSMRKVLVIKIFKNNDLFMPLLDSGAELSLISARLANKLRLHVFKPQGSKHIKLGNKSLVARNGFVILPITVMFPGTKRKPIVIKQQFEVFDCEPEFVFGVDVLPTLFPNDEFTGYMMPPASITRKPIVQQNQFSVQDENNHMDVEDEDICQNSETFWDQVLKNATPTYSLCTEDSTKSNGSTNKVKSSQDRKIDIEMLSNSDHRFVDVNAAIDREMKEMHQEMSTYEKSQSNDMSVEDVDTSDQLEHNDIDSKQLEILEKLSQYLHENNIEWKGPFRSSFEKRLQRYFN